MSGLVLIVSVALLVQKSQATCIVALFDHAHRTLVIASDCRINHGQAHRSGCKIVTEQGCTAALAGLFLDDSTDFHLEQFVREACRQRGSLQQRADAFVRIARAPNERTVGNLHPTTPAPNQEALPGTTQVLFAGVQGGRLVLLVRGFSTDDAGNVTVESYNATDGNLSGRGYFLGLNQHIREYVKEHADWQAAGALPAAKHLVELEIAAHPTLAGPPITLVQIDSSGHVHWLDKGACDSPERNGQDHETIE